MSQTIRAVFLPMSVMYLMMLLGFLRYWMSRRQKSYSALTRMIDPLEMSFAALILDVTGIVSLYSDLRGGFLLNEKVATVLPFFVGILLLIIHLQLYVHFLRYRLDELDPNAEDRRYRFSSLDLMLSMLAVLSNAMTVLAVLG